MKQIILTLAILGYSIGLFCQETGTFTDSRDGKVYKTVKIGTQWVMAENLAYKPEGGNYRAYDNDESNVAKYGYLYDWNTARLIAPEGWHLPKKKEWKTLTNHLSSTAKTIYSVMAEGSPSGFNGVLSGSFLNDSTFSYKNMNAYYWSASDFINGDVWYLALLSMDNGINISRTASEEIGFSIRLFKDE